MGVKEKIGKGLKKLRIDHNKSFKDLSSITGKSALRLYLYEKAIIHIPIEDLVHIHDVYGITVGEFLSKL